MTLAEKTTVLLMNRNWIDIDYVKVITKLKLEVELIRSARFCLYPQYSWFICFVYPSALLYCIYPASAAPCWCCADFFL